MKALLSLLLCPFLISAPALLLCPFLAIALALADDAAPTNGPIEYGPTGEWTYGPAPTNDAPPRNPLKITIDMEDPPLSKRLPTSDAHVVNPTCPGPECPTLHGRTGTGLPGAPPLNSSRPNALAAPAIVPDGSSITAPAAENATANFQVTASFQFTVPNQVASVTFTPPAPVSVPPTAGAGFTVTKVGVVMADGKPFPGTFGPLKPISMPAEATAGSGRILMPVAIDPKTGVITVVSPPLVAGDYSFDVPVILP